MTCSHKRFRIPPPNGPTSLGACMDCDYTRTMVNFIPEGFNGWRGKPGALRRKKQRASLDELTEAQRWANRLIHDNTREQ